MQDFEKLGVFFLGRAYDLKAGKLKEDLILYDSKDLVTHAVCVGMTGSGKTGLCVTILEEAAVDGIPAIAIDPKGDLSNLMLTFPNLTPEEFLPWVNPDEARLKDLSLEHYAAKQADMWKSGLASWGQDGSRIQRFRDAVDCAVYTPGSNAGIPLSILSSFAAPSAVVVDDAELFAERVSTMATSLLTLMGVDADPMRSREHILISTILSEAWKAGRDLDLASLIQEIQTPPVTRIGVLDIESFYPSTERFKLAMQLNNLLAAPGFGIWLEGEPLDIDHLLYTDQGRPRLSIVSIAHLDDTERMFFVSLLLNQLLGWMRAQSGTTTLRALFYMDEIFGYFPPVANPPSKTPLLTLLKQARAFGLGIILATQNPVDLDYKGLSNAGTWFIGRLQTERDKARVLEGLEGAAASASSAFSRREMEQTLAGLTNRVFLLQNVHEDAPEIFHTRWALSYLRGPLTREQIKTLMAPRKAAGYPPSADGVSAAHAAVGATVRTTVGAGAAGRAIETTSRPVVPPDVPQFFLPPSDDAEGQVPVIYEPFVFGSAEVRFLDLKLDIDYSKSISALVGFGESAAPVNWDEACVVAQTVSDLESDPGPDAAFRELPSVGSKAKNYGVWSKDFAIWLQRSQKLQLLHSPQTGLVSRPEETERDFRIRLRTVAREKRDEAADRLRRKYAPELKALEERVRRAEQAVAREKEQSKQQQLDTAVSLGATLIGAFFGRRGVSSSVGRATTTARSMARVMRQSGDIGRAKETAEALQQQLNDLEAEFRAEVDALETTFDPQTESLDTITLRPKKADVTVDTVALVWRPRGRPARD